MAGASSIKRNEGSELRTLIFLVIVWIIFAMTGDYEVSNFVLLIIEITQGFLELLLLSGTSFVDNAIKIRCVLIRFSALAKVLFKPAVYLSEFLPLIKVSAIALDIVFVSKNRIRLSVSIY
jgi:hypothetical protein